ncbi:hypothetical protein BBF96_10580 [Anoxybacter fermentans]|uniref:L,D-TPase catalytic domain-containing protein n=1 Tax=Anoxybacter fermentans TaxID=1323375 RepID=A0A3S9T045_9FIRM|nr:peptidoglycan-binding protein [Anoxybacter fermentans]AZR73792.1 hypothetical protein BBF96_10580 [Anoxybacter fermentans]
MKTIKFKKWIVLIFVFIFILTFTFTYIFYLDKKPLVSDDQKNRNKIIEESAIDQMDIQFKKQNQNLSLEPAANLEDIIKASKDLFLLKHMIENGQEWIKGELENYPVLKYSEPMLRNDDVKGVQAILKKLDFYYGAIDGIYGPKTLAAVKKLQKRYGLKPTGIMDLDDYNLLARVYEENIEENIPVVGKSKPEGKVSILIVLDERTLYVFEDNKIFAKFPVAIGKRDTPSPIGNWKIISKDSWGGGFGTHWLGLNVPYGKYGIHGTNKPWSIGTAASHGCFRMFNRDIETLYKWVTWGTRVFVVGGNFPYNLPWRTINDGDRGSDVWMVQNRLRELGYYKWRPDGIFGYRTKKAVQRFQKDYGLPADGEVGWSTLQKLGFYLFQ